MWGGGSIITTIPRHRRPIASGRRSTLLWLMMLVRFCCDYLAQLAWIIRTIFGMTGT
jgi:hypothetical protein